MEIFDVRKDETRPVALALLLSFAIGVPRVFTLAAANDLFMSEYGPANLPWAYSIGAFVLAIMGVGYVRTGRRFAPRTVGLAALAGLAALNALAYLGLELLGPRIVSFALIVGVEAEFTLTSLTFWGVASRLFSIQQARRLFGLVSAGEVIPTIVGGLALPWLVEEVGVWNLLLISVAGHAAAAIALLAVEDTADQHPTEEEASPPRAAGAAEVAQRRYLRWLAALVALNVFVYYAVDNAFYHATQQASLGTGALAAFLGDFFVALGLLSLAFKVFLSGRWRTWLGLRVSLLSVPATLAVLAGVVLLSQGTLHTATGALLAVVLLKLWERVSIEAIHVPSLHALLLPLPGPTREAARGTLDGVVAHSATLITGGLLLALNQSLELGVIGLTTVTLLALLLWGVFALRVASSYGDVLRTALAERRLDATGLRVADATTLGMLEEGINSADASRVLWNLHLLQGLGHPNLEKISLRLIRHADPVVVEAAARLLERQGTAKCAPALQQRLEDAADLAPRAQARLLRALASTAPDHAPATMRAHLGHEDPTVIAAAAVGLFRFGGSEGARTAAPRLTILSRSDEPRARQMAARAVGSIGQPSVARLLTRLLKDRDIGVKRTAVHAAGRLADPSLWPFVIDALGPSRLRDAAADALVRGGSNALPDVLEAARRPGQYWRLRHRLVDIAARIGGDEAVQFLLHTIIEDGREDLDLRYAALRALDDARLSPNTKDRRRLEPCVDMEFRVHRLCCEAIRQTRDWVPGDLLADALEHERRRSRDRLLLLLGTILGDAALREARTFAASSNKEDRGLAAELLEQSLPRAWAERVLPSLEADESRAQGRSSSTERAKWLAGLPRQTRQWGLRWLTVCAAEAATAAGAQVDDLHIGDSANTLSRVRALRGDRMLRGLSGQQLSDLAVRARVRQLQPGEGLLAAGERTRILFVLHQGVLSHAVSGKPPGLRTPPFKTDSVALLRALPSSATLTAEADSEVIEVHAEHLQDLLDDDVEATWQILQAMCDRLRAALAPAPLHVDPPAPPRTTAEAEGSYYDVLQRLVTLRAIPTFHSVEEHILLALAEAVREESYAAEQAVVAQGDLGTSMYILLEGEVRVHVGEQTVAMMQAPNIFGELSAISPAPRSASITAVRPVRAFVLSRATLRGLALAQQDILLVMMDLLLDRMNLGTQPEPRPTARPAFTTDDMTL